MYLLFNYFIMFICSNCGSVTSGQTKNNGSGLAEMLLYLFFIIPGLIYSAHRRANKSTVCSKCGNTNLVNSDSPVGKDLIEKYKIDIEKETKIIQDQENMVTIVMVIVFVLLVTYLLVAA